MAIQLKSIGLRPGSYTTYDTVSLLKFFAGFVLVILIITWICFEIFDYIPSSEKVPITEFFQNPEPDNSQPSDIYYKPVPRPANNLQHLDTNTITNDIQYDADILRANRYYNTTDGLSREIPVTNLLSLTNEMPTTYMISVLDTIRTDPDASTFSFPVTPGIQELIDYYTQSPNSVTKAPARSIFLISNLYKLSPQDLSEVSEFAELFAICRLWLVTKINMVVLDTKLSEPSHPFAQFQIINSRNTKIFVTESELIPKDQPSLTTGGLTLICDMMIYRPYKTHTFNIQSTINIIPAPNPNTNTNTNPNPNTNDNILNCKIIDIRLIGSTIAGEVQGSDETIPHAFNGINASSAPVSIRSPASSIIPNAVDIAIGDYSAGSVGLEKNEAEYIARYENKGNTNAKDKNCGDTDIRNRMYESARTSGDSTGQHSVASPLQNIDATTRRYLELNCGGKCFGIDPTTNAVIELFKYNDNKIACESTHNELNGSVGVYDYPCKQDSDCPYYQANKNYPNTFGKCIKSSGVCEMPEGVIRMGYKMEHKAGRAKCNNCAKLPGYATNTLIDEACCVEQQNNLALLNINSPDYRFKGDYTVRLQSENSDALKTIGLTP